MRNAPDCKYCINPGESIVIYTNENVTLNSEYFGLLLPKVKDEERGLFISTSYVDPNWTGVLQVLVSNKSEYPQHIKGQCEIANLVLMKTSEQIEYLKEIQHDHYALTWSKIFTNPEYLKWENRKRTGFIKFLHAIRTRWVLATTIGIVGIIPIVKGVIEIARFIIDLFKHNSAS